MVTRTIRIWQVWDSDDMNESDSFFPTKKAALAHLDQTYGIKPKMLAHDDSAGCLSAIIADDDGNIPQKGHSAYVRTFKIKLTAEGIATALKYIPNR